MNSEQAVLQKLIAAGLLQDGEHISYQNLQGVITKAGTVYYDNKHFKSVTEWISDLNQHFGLTDKQYPWTKASVRGLPLEHHHNKLADADGLVPETKQSGLTDFKVPQTLNYSERKRKTDSAESSSYDEDSDNRKQRKITSGDVAQNRYTSDSSLQTCSTSCKYPNCMICNKGLPSHFNTQSPTWADILQVVLYALGVSNPQKEFFSLGKEIYDYVDLHWDKLSAKPRSSTWKQTAKMTLAHSRYANLFENGYDIFMKTGFWRLKKQSNPYETSGVSLGKSTNDTIERSEEPPSDESEHESRIDRGWDANNKLNSPPAYKINYLLAENKPQPSIPNLTAYNNPTQMPTPPMAPQFYNTYNSFQKTQMNSPPPQFNPIKPNEVMTHTPSSSNFYSLMTPNNVLGQSMPQLHHSFFPRRFSVDEGAKTLEDLRNASSFGQAESDPNLYPQRLPDVNNNPLTPMIDPAPVQQSQELVMNGAHSKQESLDAMSKQQVQATVPSPSQTTSAPLQRHRSMQHESTNSFAVPESRATLRSSNPSPLDGFVNPNSAGEQYSSQLAISLEENIKNKSQLISKLYEELAQYRKHAETLRQTLEDRDRTNKELSGVITSLQTQLQKEQETSQMYQHLAKYNEDQRIRLEALYKQMSDLMGRQTNRSPDQMKHYPLGTGIMNVAATPNGDARTSGFHSLNPNGGKMSHDVDGLRYS